MPRSRRRVSWAFRLFLILLIGAALWLAWEAVTWPNVGRLARERPSSTAFIDDYRARQRALGKPDRVAWTWTPYQAISSDVKRAVLVAEDINFFSHKGFELAELQNALEDALRDREMPRGASTITQQLVKNLWLSPSRNPWRKAKEAILTWQMERVAAEAPHPRAVPERRGARARRLRRRRREPALLRQARRRARAGGGGAARGGPAEPARVASRVGFLGVPPARGVDPRADGAGPCSSRARSDGARGSRQRPTAMS